MSRPTNGIQLLYLADLPSSPLSLGSPLLPILVFIPSKVPLSPDSTDERVDRQTRAFSTLSLFLSPARVAARLDRRFAMLIFNHCFQSRAINNQRNLAGKREPRISSYSGRFFRVGGGSVVSTIWMTNDSLQRDFN